MNPGTSRGTRLPRSAPGQSWNGEDALDGVERVGEFDDFAAAVVSLAAVAVAVSSDEDDRGELFESGCSRASRIVLPAH